MKRVLVVAGGEWQAPLISRLKNEGFFVLNSNLYMNSPGFRFANRTLVADVLDKEKNCEFARAEQVDAVLTDESDIAVPTVAYIAEQLGLPGITVEKAELFTNKFKMCEFCHKYGFPVPAYKLCATVEDASIFLEEYGQIIIKPLDNQSSRGVYCIHNMTELNQHFAETKQCSRVQPKVLAEEYIDGREFTVDAVVVDGICTPLATSIKYQFQHNTNITQTLYFTNESKEYDLDNLKAVNKRLVEKMGLPFGLTHAEYKYRDDKFYLIEIAARGGGTRISSHIVPLMSGVDNYELLIRQALGEYPAFSIIPNDQLRCRKAVLEFFDFPSGMITGIDGLEDVRTIPGVVEIHLDFSVGDILCKPSDDRSRAGFFIAYAETETELKSIRNKVKETLRVSFER